MDNLTAVYRINADDNYDERQKVKRITANLLRDELIFNDGKLMLLNAEEYHLRSTSVVSFSSSGAKDNPAIAWIYRRMQREKVTLRIICAVNEIPLKTSRILFVQRYIYHYSCQRMMRENHLCSSAVYNYLHIGEQEFLAHL